MTIRRSNRAVAATALAVTAAACALSAAGPTATASATTSIDQSNFLDFPHEGVQSTICSQVRTLRLRGTYHFQAYSAHRLHPEDRPTNTRRLRLHGAYTWQVCLNRNVPRVYRIVAYVRNVATGGRASITHDQSGARYGDGNYHWGSTIDNVR